MRREAPRARAHGCRLANEMQWRTAELLELEKRKWGGKEKEASEPAAYPGSAESESCCSGGQPSVWSYRRGRKNEEEASQLSRSPGSAESESCTQRATDCHTAAHSPLPPQDGKEKIKQKARGLRLRLFLNGSSVGPCCASQSSWQQSTTAAGASRRVPAFVFGSSRPLWPAGFLHGLQVGICSASDFHGLQGDSLPSHHGRQGTLCSIAPVLTLLLLLPLLPLTLFLHSCLPHNSHSSSQVLLLKC
ncbi:uncharacterized protein LOC122154526 [Tyto alba]|uniref:uncharacterized protein LOC122154526 n=1 Tax=Tyto alba TaxID=56313 RepID=UPI001C67ED38|nr:uncharacterized protein LOC122154526 [Tyto alba]